MDQKREESISLKSGIISMFNSKKGFGFIKQDDGAKDMFFHISGVQDIPSDLIKEGLKIKFTVESNAGKERAINITLKLA